MRALIADDSQIVRDRLRGYLRDCGHEVVAMAVNGREAVDKARETKPDIAVIDISMPVMNGDQAAIVIRTEKTVRYILVATSQVQHATLAPLINLGIDIIAKPFYREKFIKKLNEVIYGDSTAAGRS